MANIPARCRQCGHVWDGAGAVGLTGGANVVNYGSTTQCPKCGGPADLADGHFTTDSDDDLVIVDGPQWSHDFIESLRSTLPAIVEENPRDIAAAVAQKVDAQLGATIADAVDAGLAAQGKPTNQRRRHQLAKRVVYGLIALVAFDYTGAVDNVTWVAERAQMLFEYVAQHGDVPPPPE